MPVDPFDSQYQYQTSFVSLRPLPIIGALAVLALFWFFGLYILTAIVPIGVGYLVAAFAMPRQSRLFLPSFGLQLGYVLLFAASLVFSQIMGVLSLWSLVAVLADMALVLVPLLWLAFRPGQAPVVMLIVLQSLGLVGNVVKLAAVWGTPMLAKSFAVHVVVRTLAIVLMARELRVWKRSRAATAEA